MSRRVHLHRALDSILDDHTWAKKAVKNLQGGGREWGGPKIKPKGPPPQTYPTWSQLKKGAKVRVNATGALLKVISQGAASVQLSDGNNYRPKELTLT